MEDVTDNDEDHPAYSLLNILVSVTGWGSGAIFGLPSRHEV